ncbi:fumarylacetoacetate hydrolase family protein [Xanthomonas citri]|uniref:fumarylacetoacetate hydrolase family protein n=1 Tax=Xanthomonas citri TaxID=346 RepID=UPI002286FB22|nr:fumarylacetoacetate hydrolase family protein [Xanthomonas citri]
MKWNWWWRWGSDAPAGELPVAQAERLIYGYGVGLDLTRRDLQAAAKAKGLPWDIAKGFDHSAPIRELVHAGEVGALEALNLSLEVNGQVRQQSLLDQMIWNVPEILHELSKLYALRAGDLIFMGTPAGVGPLLPATSSVRAWRTSPSATASSRADIGPATIGLRQLVRDRSWSALWEWSANSSNSQCAAMSSTWRSV